VIEGQQEDNEQPGGAADQGGDHAPHALLLVMQRAVSRPVWRKAETHRRMSKTVSGTVVTPKVESLTCEAAVEHPGSH